MAHAQAIDIEDVFRGEDGEESLCWCGQPVHSSDEEGYPKNVCNYHADQIIKDEDEACLG